MTLKEISWKELSAHNLNIIVQGGVDDEYI